MDWRAKREKGTFEGATQSAMTQRREGKREKGSAEGREKDTAREGEGGGQESKSEMETGSARRDSRDAGGGSRRKKKREVTRGEGTRGIEDGATERNRQREGNDEHGGFAGGNAIG